MLLHRTSVICFQIASPITIRGIVRFLIELLDAATDSMAGLFAESQNFDSDPRVWKGIVDNVTKEP